MKCIGKYVGPSPKAPGFHLYLCVRRGCSHEAHSPYGLDKIVWPECPGQLMLSDGPAIIESFIDAFEIPRAAAIVRYIRWRFKGSPLNELPRGVPSPQIAAKPLTDAEVAELFPGEDPTLLGNRIKALTDAMGIPTCGGCDKRREWLNRAHEWLRS